LEEAGKKGGEGRVGRAVKRKRENRDADYDRANHATHEQGLGRLGWKKGIKKKEPDQLGGLNGETKKLVVHGPCSQTKKKKRQVQTQNKQTKKKQRAGEEKLFSRTYNGQLLSYYSWTWMRERGGRTAIQRGYRARDKGLKRPQKTTWTQLQLPRAQWSSRIY